MKSITYFLLTLCCISSLHARIFLCPGRVQKDPDVEYTLESHATFYADDAPWYSSYRNRWGYHYTYTPSPYSIRWGRKRR